MSHSATQLSSDLPQNLSVGAFARQKVGFCSTFGAIAARRLAALWWQDALQNRNVQRVLRV
jgi:hypothetical protein